MSALKPSLILLALVSLSLPAVAAQPQMAPSFPANGLPGLQQAVSAPGVMVTKVEVGNSIGTYGAKAILRATFMSGSTPLANRGVYFYVDGVKVSHSLTSVAGKAEMDYTVPTSLTVGDHEIKAHYVGEAGVPASTGTGRLAVLKGATNIKDMWLNIFPNTDQSAAPGTVKVSGDGQVFRVADGAGVDGRQIDILLDGQKIGAAATNDVGKFSFTLPSTKGSGNFNVVARFAGDSRYTGCEIGTSKSYTPPPPPPPPPLPMYTSIFVTPLGQAVVGGRVLVMAKASLLSGGNPGLPNVKMFVSARLKGSEGGDQMEKATSGPDGVVKVELPILDAGEHSYRAGSDDPRYTSSGVVSPGMFVSQKLVAQKAPLNVVVVNGPKSAKIGENIAINIELRNAVFNGPVKFERVGVTYSPTMIPTKGPITKTGQDGRAVVYTTVDYSLGLGQQQIYLFAGDEGTKNYIPKIIAYPITVLPKDN